MSARCPRLLLAILLSLGTGWSARPPVVAQTGPGAAQTGELTQAEVALNQGKELYRRNRTDQSLALFEAALKLYTDAGDEVGAAAAHDALGNVYLRQGQYDIALQHFKAAAAAYRTWNELANANLMFAKLGEAYYLAGQPDAAQTAFAQIAQQAQTPERTGGNNSGGRNGNRGSAGGAGAAGGAATFAAISAAVPGLYCDTLGPRQPPRPQGNNPGMPSEPPNMGHAPKGPDGIGRMDLRVTDEQGQPVKDVRAKLSTKRTNGFLCDCTNQTDPTGRALMNPIHVGPNLKLELKAPGYPTQTIDVQPEAMAQPYRVTLRHSGGALTSSSGATSAAQSASSKPPVSTPRACFDLFGLFISYATSEAGLGRIAYARNDLAGASLHFTNLLTASDEAAPVADLQAARLYRAVARTSLGDIALRQGRYLDAIKLYMQATDAAQRDQRPELAWGAQRGLGRSYWLQAEAARDLQTATPLRAAARRSYLAAIETIEKLLAGSLRADDARTNFLARTKDVYDEAVGISAEMSFMAAAPTAAPAANQTLAHAAQANAALSGPALSYAVEAFKLAEQGRARSLLDLLGETHVDITAGVPAALVQRKADNLARQQELADLLIGVRPNGSTPAQTVPQLEAELTRLTAEYDSLENQIRLASPRYATLVRPQPLALADVRQRVLDDQTALLEYSLGAEHSYLWAVTKNGGLALYRMPARAAVEAQVVELRQQLIPVGAQQRSIVNLTDDQVRGLRDEMESEASGRGLTLGMGMTHSAATFATAANALYQSVFAPAAAFVGTKRLLIVADGALNYVPFEALVTAPDGTDYAALPYLVRTNEIIYAPSASVVAALRQAAAGRSGRGLLVVADPVFDATDPRAQGTDLARSGNSAPRLSLDSALADMVSPRFTGLRLMRLRGTRTEAEQIAQLATTAGTTADVWLDLEASEGNVLSHELSNYRIVHFATHGLLDAERPQFTGLALAPGGADSDGFLRVGEVFNLRLGSPLVILSACETGLGKEKRGEGVIGLTRAFMYAGAPQVGVSLWSVADRSTAALMPDFYKRLLTDNAGAPAALRAAQLQMIGDRRYSAPYFWAPFVLVGDWQ